jgi:hypothetical protein
MRVIGSDKIGFLSVEKHGSTSLSELLTGYDFIQDSPGQYEDYPSEKIILFPWRDEFESIKSGFLQDISEGLEKLLSKYQPPRDEDLSYIFRYIFNKKNNVHDKTSFIGDGRIHMNEYYDPEGQVINALNVGYDHKQLLIRQDFFQYFLTDSDKFYFFDLKHLSNPKLIKWISEHDPRWKNISISCENSSLDDMIKRKIKNILPQIKEELGEDYLDYKDKNNWYTFKHYYEFSKMFFESRKKSKQFLDFDKM